MGAGAGTKQVGEVNIFASQPHIKGMSTEHHYYKQLHIWMGLQVFVKLHDAQTIDMMARIAS